MVCLDSSKTHPPIAFDPSCPDVEQAISMEVSDLTVLSDKTGAAEAVGSEVDPRQGTRVDLDLFHRRQPLWTGHGSPNQQ